MEAFGVKVPYYKCLRNDHLKQWLHLSKFHHDRTCHACYIGGYIFMKKRSLPKYDNVASSIKLI